MKTLINVVIVTIMLASLSACVALPPYGQPYYGSPYYAGSYHGYYHHGGWGHHW